MAEIVGKVVAFSEEGNLITDITSDQLATAPRDQRVTVICDEHETSGIFTQQHAEPEATFMALVGPNDVLELTIVGESARLMLGIRLGEKVTVRW